jgi:hypothetical protein
MFRPYTDLIPPDVKWVRDAEHWQSMNAQAVPPRDEARRRRCWIDPLQSQFPSWPGDIWFTGQPAHSFAYRGLARDAQGKLLLASPTDDVLMYTYESSAALPSIRQYSYVFAGLGVPYLTREETITEDLAGYNFSSRFPAVDYPIAMPGGVILIPGEIARARGAQGGYDCYAVHYQDPDWLALCRPPVGMDLAARLARVGQILASGLSAEDKRKAILSALTDFGGAAVLT